MQESLRDFDIAAVAEKAATGDRQAIAELFERKAESIYFTAFGILGDRTDAQDAAQEAVLRICQSIGSLKDPKAVEAWVLKIVRNVCYAMLNKAKPVRDAMDIEDMTLCLAEDDGDVVPERYAEDRERREQLFKIVMGLSTGQRETIFMYYYDDMSVKEIAGVTATNVNTVTANLTKARKMIRKRLMEDKQQYEGIAPSIMAAPASASALGRVLKESSTAMFTPEIKTALCERWTSALWGGHAGTSVSAASAEAASGPAVNIGVAVMVSLVAFTGILYLNIRHDIGAYADQATTSVIRSYGDVD
ncbi:MAG: sigma-70 family RNA polymerase sigma factor, partial [Clostridiales Family XIII bacterium]|nr:sigma-70 family RNA polymerase sigma factor [Clostridiales Family XIII bacterium]